MIDLKALPSVFLENKNSLPKCPAIYAALSKENEVLYIGLANDLSARWATHNRLQQLRAIGDIRICWLEVSDKSILPEIEKALIDYFQPELNGKAVPGIKRLTLDISEPLHKAIKGKAVVAGVPMADMLRELLESHYL